MVIIETRPAYPEKIFIFFEEPDFELTDKWGGHIWVKAKDEIKETFPFPVGEWNRTLGCWLINNTDENMETLREIKQRYFEDVNQIELL